MGRAKGKRKPKPKAKRIVPKVVEEIITARGARKIGPGRYDMGPEVDRAKRGRS